MMRNRITQSCARGIITSLLCTIVLNPIHLRAEEEPQVIRVGMVSLDTSHVVAFAKLMNDSKSEGPLAEVRVVAAYPGGSPDFPLSTNRVKGFTKQVRELGVEIVPSIAELLGKVDAVMLMSVDGRPHLEQFKQVLPTKKPVFIDKPCAASLADVVEIFRLANEHGVPCFSSSSSRFSGDYRQMRNNPDIGRVKGCDAYSQSRAAPHHPDLFWYGCHGVDLLFTVMGTGCRSVRALQTPYTEQVTGVWNDVRVGNYRSIREHTSKTGLGVTVFGEKAIVYNNHYYDYRPLVVEIAKFFKSGKAPFAAEETVEAFAFMEAAEESKRSGGKTVLIADVLKKVRQETIQRKTSGTTQ